MTKTGPNDMSCIVWALGEHLSFFFLRIVDTNAYFIAFIRIILQNIQWREIRSHHHLTLSPRLVPGQTGGKEGGKGRQRQGRGLRCVAS